MKPRAIIVFILFAAMLSPVLSLAEGVALVANKDVPEASLSAGDVKQIFLGKRTTWSNDDKIVFVVQNQSDPSDTFLKEYLQKNASQYKNYWKKQVFAGEGTAPQSFSSDKELVDFVAQTPGAIGYVSSTADKGNVKTITVR